MSARAPVLPALAALVAGASALACASSRGRLTPIEELPPRYRAAIEAYGAGAETWAAERDAFVSDPAIADFLVDNLVLEMTRAYDQSKLFRTGEVRGPFERARDELVLLADRSTPVLVELLCSGDGVQAFLAEEALGRIGRDAVPAVAACLERPGDEARRRAAELLGELPNAGDDETEVEERLAACLASDRSWIVRAQVARSLGERALRHTSQAVARSALLGGLGDEDATVALECGRRLAALGDLRAVPALINALERARLHADARSAKALQLCLEQLTGHTGSVEPRAWRDWWREHGVRSLPASGGAAADIGTASAAEVAA